MPDLAGHGLTETLGEVKPSLDDHVEALLALLDGRIEGRAAIVAQTGRARLAEGLGGRLAALFFDDIF